MSTAPDKPWAALLPPASGADALTLRFRLLRKRGQPLLLVPPGSDGLTASLALYPAQSRKARLARSLASLGLRLRLPMLSEEVTISCERDAPFLRFLQADETSAPPRFTVFFCNPRPGGQRFILLAFDGNGNPTRVVKAGTGAGATAVIQRERDFLVRLSTDGVPGVPNVIASFDSPTVQAVALHYVSGVTPEVTDWPAAGTVLTPWLRPTERIKARELIAWEQLRTNSTDPLAQRLEQTLGDIALSAAIHHGDFAPWNIRVNRATGEWQVLDWERGEMTGPPGWDWFHFLIQPLILVQRKPTAEVAGEVERFLAGEPFKSYARTAGIERCAREWLLAYLLHARDVTKPSEGGPATAALLEHFRQRWLQSL